MLTTRRPRRRGERGQVLALFAIFLVVLLGATAVTVDYGTWLKVRRDYQNAADPAALAGAAQLGRPDNATKRANARRAAWEDLNRSLKLGLSAGTLDSLDNANTGAAGQTIGDYTIWVSTPASAAGAAYPGASTKSRTMFVRVQRDNPAYFSRILGIGDRTVDGWATAEVFPGRFAVVTLREEGMAPVSIPQNIRLSGTDTTLEVIDGDVGGNWNMKLNAGSQLWLRGTSGNDSDVYLVDHVSCGPACWNLSQVNSGPNGSPANETKPVLELPGVLADPMYVLPDRLDPPTSGAKPGTIASPGVPLGDIGGDVDVRSGGPSAAPGGASLVGGVLTCDPASPRIGPGYYTKIRVRGGKCLILDPTFRHTSITAAVPDVATPVAQDQLPGVFYIDGDIDVNADAMLVGDGVTLVIRPDGNALTVSGGGVVDLNRGVSPITAPTAHALGAWLADDDTTANLSTYTWNSSTARWVYNSALDATPSNVGMSIYVVKRSQYESAGPEDNSNVIGVTSGAALSWNGVTYAPRDNINLSGRPGHDGIGQFISWTFTFAGGVNVKQTYDGPGDGIPYLIEPRLGQ